MKKNKAQNNEISIYIKKITKTLKQFLIFFILNFIYIYI